MLEAGESLGWCRTAVGWSYGFSLSVAAVVPLFCGLWLYAWGRVLPPGAGRLAVAAPVVAINLLVPKLFCRFTDAIALLIMTFNLGWLSNFKAVSWALDRGALCMLRFTPVQFLAVYATPVTPAAANGQTVEPQESLSLDTAIGEEAPSSLSHAGGGSAASIKHSSGAASGASLASSSSAGGGGAAAAAGRANGGVAGSGGGSTPAAEPGVGLLGCAKGAVVAHAYPGLPRRPSQGRLGEDVGGWREMLLSWGAKNAFIVVIVWVMQLPLPGLVESFAYGLALYALLSSVMDGPAVAVIGLTGLRVSPHFDRPWRSTSVAAFWSKRWDLAAGNTLRQLVYDPIWEGSLLAPQPGAPHRKPSAARQTLGTTAAFAMSGAVHEMIFWYLTGRTTGGVWFAFFLVQAPLIVAERLLLSSLKRRGILLPAWLRNAVTALVVVTTGQYLFWPPAKTHGVVESSVGNTWAGILQLGAAVHATLTR